MDVVDGATNPDTQITQAVSIGRVDRREQGEGRVVHDPAAQNWENTNRTGIGNHAPKIGNRRRLATC